MLRKHDQKRIFFLLENILKIPIKCVRDVLIRPSWHYFTLQRGETSYRKFLIFRTHRFECLHVAMRGIFCSLRRPIVNKLYIEKKIVRYARRRI